ncbi:MAG: TonB-dependent receptor, partial [Pseudomonadota bacterium]
DEFDEIGAFIPGLVVQEQSPNNPGFVIRGITSDSGSAQIAPRVTIYYNGVDVSRSRGSYFDLFDIERIEVVKGPQATLFGTASTIGAISVIPAKPVRDYEAFGSVSYGNFDAVQFNGMVNAGGEKVAARIAGVYKRRDGYVNNIAGEPGTASAAIVGVDQDDLNGVDQFGIRGTFSLFPETAAGEGRIDLTVTYEEQNNPGTAFISGTIPPTDGEVDFFGDAELGGAPAAISADVLGDNELGLERDVFDVNLTAEIPISDTLTLTSITGYREFNSLEVFDADGSALFFLEFAEDAEGEQISTEARLAYDDGNRLTGFIGFNIFLEDGTQTVPFATDEGTFLACAPFDALADTQAGISAALGGVAPCVAADGTLNAPLVTGALTGGAASVLPYSSVFANGGQNEAYSLFLDASYLITDRLELTAGIRYLAEDRVSTFIADQPNSVLGGFPLLGVADTGGVTFRAENNTDTFLPRANIRYEFLDGINAYATFSRGRRPPVVDLGSLATPAGTVPEVLIVPREEVWNYEGGIKGERDGISGSVALFFQDYSNFQTTFIDEFGILQPVDAGEASNIGVEVEAAARITPWLRAFANYAYIDSGIDEPAEDAFPGVDFVGSTFRLQPEHSASGGLDVQYDLGNGIDLSFTPTITYRSEVFFEIPNDPEIS